MTLEYIGDTLHVKIPRFLDEQEEKKLKDRIALIMGEYGIKKLIIELEH